MAHPRPGSSPPITSRSRSRAAASSAALTLHAAANRGRRDGALLSARVIPAAGARRPTAHQPVKASKQHVSVLFYRGAKLPGRNPSLEGGGGTVRYMRFEDPAAVRSKKADLQAAIRAWIQMKSA